MSITERFISRQLRPYMDTGRWLVAYSGGVDSCVLLNCLMGVVDHPPIVAVHINHQLQPESTQWRKHCEQHAAAIGIDIICVDVNVDLESGHSLEDAARRARYNAFETIVRHDDVLFFGHHQDDQVETVMLRLLRGSGSLGAAGIPSSRPLGNGQLARPLLEISRSAIETYAIDHQLEWIDDPSNQTLDFDRNFLRLNVLPSIEQRWPGYRQTLSRTATLNEEAALLNDELAAIDLQLMGVSEQSPATLPIDELSGLSRARQKNSLRYFLKLNQLATPSSAQLNEVIDQLIGASEDAVPLVEWGGVQLRRFDHKIVAMRSLATVDTSKRYTWDFTDTLILGAAGYLTAIPSRGKGIDVARLNIKELGVAFRQGGERCQPVGRSGSQTLKKLFQEYQLEPWLRDRIPLITYRDQIIAVGDLWVCEGWQVKDDRQGVSLLWQREN
jgi:tRNA(Ile)-lysidine synthase